MDQVVSLVNQKPAVIFTRSSCCVGYAMTRLIVHEIGANANVCELDCEPKGSEMESALAMMLKCNPVPLPIMFIGGDLVGNLQAITSLHLQNQLIPRLKDAGAILFPPKG